MARVQAADYAEKQGLILETAAELFASQGFNATSISMLANACGASKAWIYHYYGSKESILHALVREYAEMLHEILPEEAGLDASPEKRFRAYLSTLMNFSTVESNRNRYVHMILLRDLDSLPEPEKQDIFAILNQHTRRLTSLICRLVPDLKNAPNMSRPITMILLGATNWLPRWYDPDGPVTPEELASVIADIFLEGLKNLEFPKTLQLPQHDSPEKVPVRFAS